MNIDAAREFLLYATVINYGVLLIWFAVFAFAHDWVAELHGRWFRLTIEQFDFAHYLGMAIYKIGVFLFGLVPLLTLYLIA